jgi:DNA-binding response OmpR family regulator
MNHKSFIEPTTVNILIVDDEPVAISFLVSLLKEQGYKVRVALNAKNALETIEIKAPNLILLDVNLPDMDGFELSQRLKTSELYREIPVIFVSASHETVDKVKAFQVGEIDYISKPFAPEEVLVRVKTYLTICAMQKQLEGQNRQLKQEIRARQQFENALQQEIAERKQTEKALKESEEKWRSITENSPDHILLIDQDATILFINRTVSDLTKEEVIGKSIYDYIPSEFNKSVSDCLKQVFETSKPDTYFTE